MSLDRFQRLECKFGRFKNDRRRKHGQIVSMVFPVLANGEYQTAYGDAEIQVPMVLTFKPHKIKQDEKKLAKLSRVTKAGNIVFRLPQDSEVVTRKFKRSVVKIYGVNPIAILQSKYIPEED